MKKISPQPKNITWAPKLVWPCDPSIGNFILMKKIYDFGGQIGENKPSEPKNRIWAPKPKWSCDTWAPKLVWPCDPSIGNFLY
jgi:hypothetical protein